MCLSSHCIPINVNDTACTQVHKKICVYCVGKTRLSHVCSLEFAHVNEAERIVKRITTKSVKPTKSIGLLLSHCREVFPAHILPVLAQ